VIERPSVLHFYRSHTVFVDVDLISIPLRYPDNVLPILLHLLHEMFFLFHNTNR
jgi:hypothetical protein